MSDNIDTQYWNKRYASGGNSGYGSYNEQLQKKLNWIEPLGFISITEVGCGDFHFGSNILRMHPVKYTGLDISDVIIDRHKKMYPTHTWRVSDGFIPQAELLLCVDVLFHILDDKEANKMLMDLKNAWSKYLVITAYERDEEMDTHVRIRKFNPSFFGTPILREIVEEDGELYFYIFKK